MLQVQDFGHSDADECFELIKNFCVIDDKEMRKRVLTLVAELAANNAQLINLEDITFS